MTSFERAAAVVIAIALAAPTARAQRSAADVETARELYNAGLTLKEHGDLRGALEKLKAAHALGRTPITGLELAKTHLALAQPVEAREVCLGVARMPVTAEETARSADARREAARLAEEAKPKIASLRLQIHGVPPGAEPEVTVDGAPVPAAALGEPRQVDPGPHTIVARASGGPEAKQTTTLGEGEAKDAALTVVAPATPATSLAGAAPVSASPEHATAEDRRMSPLVIPGFAVAAAGASVGAVTGILALTAKSDLDAKCAGGHCGPDQYSALDRAKTMGTVSTVAFIVGALGGVVGVYGITHPVRAARTAFVQPHLGFGSVGIHGAF